MDSGSWFAIWAICLRTSFFVIMPRSLLEKKQNREKGQPCNIGSSDPQRPSHLGAQRDHISQLSLQMGGANWESSGQWRVGGGEQRPSQVTCTFPLSSAGSRGVSKGLRSQKMNQEPSDSKTWALGWLCGAQLTPAATHTGCEWHGRKINLYCVWPLILQDCLLLQ